MSYRLDTGGRLIDRDTRVLFTFNGRSFSGCAGDTLASALLANDQTLVGRSFKYHRPRGIVTAGPEEPNALVGLGSDGTFEPNARATIGSGNAANGALALAFHNPDVFGRVAGQSAIPFGAAPFGEVTSST